MFMHADAGALPDFPAPRSAGLLVDAQGRQLDYLRLAVTDRCNLRCSYCMPDGGIVPVDHANILSFEEALRLCQVFCGLGVRKIRVTGGEPLVRRGTVPFMARLASMPQHPEVLLTTNGVLLAEHLDDLAVAGLRRVNLSLDSLEPDTWRLIARREGFAAARRALDLALARGLGVKVNVVVLAGINDHELVAFAALTRDLPIDVRFIEAMPFDGGGGRPEARLAGPAILSRLESVFTLVPDGVKGVARMFRVEGHAGRVGLIEGHGRKFCGNCSRLRLDSRGRLRTCLYGAPVLDLRALLLAGAGDAEIVERVKSAVACRARDGFAAEQGTSARGLSSMADIGG